MIWVTDPLVELATQMLPVASTEALRGPTTGITLPVAFAVAQSEVLPAPVCKAQGRRATKPPAYVPEAGKYCQM